MTDDELKADFIARKGVTKCPDGAMIEKKENPVHEYLARGIGLKARTGAGKNELNHFAGWSREKAENDMNDNIIITKNSQ